MALYVKEQLFASGRGLSMGVFPVGLHHSKKAALLLLQYIYILSCCSTMYLYRPQQHTFIICTYRTSDMGTRCSCELLQTMKYWNMYFSFFRSNWKTYWFLVHKIEKKCCKMWHLAHLLHFCRNKLSRSTFEKSGAPFVSLLGVIRGWCECAY